MNKLAQAIVEDSQSDSMQEAAIDSDKLHLKKKKEDEIRMKLDEFARELSNARKQREQH